MVFVDESILDVLLLLECLAKTEDLAIISSLITVAEDFLLKHHLTEGGIRYAVHRGAGMSTWEPTAAAEIVETHVLYHCVAFVCAFSFLECYMSCHMYHGVRTFEILKIHRSQPILLLFQWRRPFQNCTSFFFRQLLQSLPRTRTIPPTKRAKILGF